MYIGEDTYFHNVVRAEIQRFTSLFQGLPAVPARSRAPTCGSDAQAQRDFCAPCYTFRVGGWESREQWLTRHAWANGIPWKVWEEKFLEESLHLGSTSGFFKMTQFW